MAVLASDRKKTKVGSSLLSIVDCCTYFNPGTLMGFVVGWLCNCKSKMCRIQEFPLNYTFIMMTLEFCFASSEDCVLLLDTVNRNLDRVLGCFHCF